MIKPIYTQIAHNLAKEGIFRVNNFYGSLTVLAEVFCFTIGLSFLIKISYFSPLYWVLQFLLGLSLFRFFVILHECGHKSLFAQKFLNTIIGTVVSPFCIIPYICWRNIHYQHHRWVGVVDKDPTQAILLSLRESSKLTHNLFRLIWKTWFPVSFFKLVFQVFWMYPIKELKQGNRANANAGFVSVLAIVIPHALLIRHFGIVEYLILYSPMLLIYAIWFENMNFSQHVGLFPYLSKYHPKPIPLHQQDAISRTTDMNPLLSVFCAYNFNLHIEHHLFPSIPWYNLRKVKQSVETVKDMDYEGVGFPNFVLELRRQDPIDIYLKTLPPDEETKTTAKE